MSSTVIAYNGSGSIQPLDALFDVLARESLDPRFGNCFTPAPLCHGLMSRDEQGRTVYLDGDPIYPEAPDMVRFHGNFARFSHVFDIDTNDPELIARLTAAIHANRHAKEAA